MRVQPSLLLIALLSLSHNAITGEDFGESNITPNLTSAKSVQVGTSLE